MINRFYNIDIAKTEEFCDKLKEAANEIAQILTNGASTFIGYDLNETNEKKYTFVCGIFMIKIPASKNKEVEFYINRIKIGTLDSKTMRFTLAQITDICKAVTELKTIA